MSDPESDYSGLGIAPIGCPIGFGVYADQVPSPFGIYQQQDGSQPRGSVDAGNLHGSTGDWEIDPFGRPYGDHAIRSKVRLALTTVRGSALDQEYGLAEFPLTVAPADLAQLRVDIRQALKPMIDSGELKIVSLDVNYQGLGRTDIKLVWQDLTRGDLYTFNLPSNALV